MLELVRLNKRIISKCYFSSFQAIDITTSCGYSAKFMPKHCGYYSYMYLINDSINVESIITKNNFKGKSDCDLGKVEDCDLIKIKELELLGDNIPFLMQVLIANASFSFRKAQLNINKYKDSNRIKGDFSILMGVGDR